MRYFADSAVALKPISAALKGVDPQFKIDGGELTRGNELLAEIEINSARTDLFDEELASKINALEHVASPAAHHVINRLRGTQSIVIVRVVDGDPAVTWERLGPLWSMLPTISTGLMQLDGQGFYDGSQLAVALA